MSCGAAIIPNGSCAIGALIRPACSFEPADFQASNNLSFVLDILVEIKVAILCEVVSGFLSMLGGIRKRRVLRMLAR